MKTKKRTKYDWNSIPTIDVYNIVLSRELKTFPHNYLTKERARTLLRYVALTKYNMSRDQICKDITMCFLRKHLLGNLNKIFGSDWHHMISYCFSEMDIKPWELLRVKEGFWEDTCNQKEFISWVAEKEKIDITSLPELRKLTGDLIRSYGGKSAIVTAGGLFNLLNFINPMNYKEWEICNLTFWNDTKRRQAIHWLIEEKLGWDSETVEKNLTGEHFYKYNLASVFDYFQHNRNRALQFAYPGKYSRLKKSPTNKGYIYNETV